MLSPPVLDTAWLNVSFISDFLETLDDGSFFSGPTTVAPSLVSSASYGPSDANPSTPVSATSPAISNGKLQTSPFMPSNVSSVPVVTASMMNRSSTMSAIDGAAADAILPSATKTEKFLLTAADQESGSRDERLNRVISSKYEAGLLKPYNYVKGYARLSRWMDRKYVLISFSFDLFLIIKYSMSQESKQQILQPLSVLRPKFRVRAFCTFVKSVAV